MKWQCCKYNLDLSGVNMKLAIGILALAAFLVFSSAQIAAGYAGIEHGIGPVFLRFTLPITVGAFFGAMTVWGWHWAPACMFAVPGLIFMFPGVISGIFSLAT